MNRERLLTLVLRLSGTINALAFFSVVMPREWMEISHEWLGMGTMPRGAVVDFMIRQASYVYGAHGITLWLLASDVQRYRPLVRFTGWVYLLAAPAFVAIEWTAGMPWFWMVGDGIGCGSFGVVVLWLSAGRDLPAADPIGRSLSGQIDECR
jgi:hypothetical protein